MSKRHLDPVWRTLHLRNACGEPLTTQERIWYQEGLQELEAGESYPGDVEELQRLLSELSRLQSENVALESIRDALDRITLALLIHRNYPK